MRLARSCAYYIVSNQQSFVNIICRNVHPTPAPPKGKLSRKQPQEGDCPEYHPHPPCGYHNNWGLLSGQSRQLPVEKLSHIPAATVPTDYRVEGQLRSRQHRLALGHYFHPASPHPTVPRVKDTVLVDERVPLGGQNEELGNHGRSGK